MEAIIRKIILAAAILNLAMLGGVASAWAQAVTTYASGSAISDPESIAFDGTGNLYVANFALGTIAKVAPGGAVSTFAGGFQHPVGLAFDTGGNLYVSDSGAVSKVTADGTVSAYSSKAAGTPVAVDAQGNLYTCYGTPPDFLAAYLMKITPTGVASTISSTHGAAPCLAISVDPSGDIYYVGSSVNFSTAHTTGVITKVTPSGASSQFAADIFPEALRVQPPPGTPGPIAMDRSGNVYAYTVYSFTANGPPVILKLDPNGNLLQTIAVPTAIDPTAMAMDAFGYLYLADKAANAIYRLTAPSPLLSAVLPGSRSVLVGTAATVFATILNTGSTAVNGCSPRLAAGAPTGLMLDYSATDPATNQSTGQFDRSVAISAGGSQSFVLAFNANAALSSPAQQLIMTCDDASPGPVTTGVNTVDLTFSTTPVTDVIVQSATVSGDGIVNVPFSTNGTGAFALATANVGVAGTLTASADTGAAVLPVIVTLCQSNPSSGACLATPAGSVPVSVAAGSTATFSIFVKATGSIAFDPGVSRIFVRFKDSGGASHGSTSVAVRTQ